GPDQVTDALEAEHRVVEEERDGVDAVVGVGGAGCDERRHRTGLCDALFQDLAVDRLLVEQEVGAVNRLVELPHAGVDAHLAEQRLHAEGTGFVGDDGNEQLAPRLVAQQLAQDVDDDHGRRDSPVARWLHELLEQFEVRGSQGLRLDLAMRLEPAQLLAPGHQVLGFLAVLCEAQERVALDLIVCDGQLEAVSERLQLVLVELLLLVSDVLRLTCSPEPVALDGAGQNHRRLALVLDGCIEGREHLEGVVTTAVEAAEVGVGVVLGGLAQLRRVEETLLQRETAEGSVALRLAVDQLLEALDYRSVDVTFQQFVPCASPRHLDHVPAGAAEDALELLDYLTVPENRPVEPLQVAVDDPYEVVKVRARSDPDGAKGLWFVGLTVTDERPHLPVALRVEAPVFEVPPEARLVDRRDGTEPHRHGRETPVVRHEPRVRIRAEARTVCQLTPEVEHLLVGKATLQVRARVEAGTGVSLEVDEVGVGSLPRSTEEVVEPDLVEVGCRGVGSDVPT